MSGSRDRDRDVRPATFKGLQNELHAAAADEKHRAVQHGQGVCEDCEGEQAKGIPIRYKKGKVQCVNGPGCRARQKRAARRAEREG